MYDAKTVPAPYHALILEENGLYKTVRTTCGSVTFGPNALPVSMIADGVELLQSPVRLCTVEDGEAGVWDENYPDNESECFVQEHDDAHAVLCGALATERFVVDLAVTVSFDGNISYDMKLATRGRTVYQGFGLAAVKPLRYRLDRLWLEVPLRAENATHFQQFPLSVLHVADGTEIPEERLNCAGAIPAADTAMSFKALCWLGNEERGLGWFSKSDARWQPADPERALEWIHDGDALILRARFFDSHPKSWMNVPPEEGAYRYYPICLHFGFHTTPVKPWKRPELLRGLHIDCFRKTKGNYIDYLSGTEFEGLPGNTETGFDRMTRLGVRTLILHEKWNKSQNNIEISEYTRAQVRAIVEECHKRGIRVLVYFGYEYSMMAPDWSEKWPKYLVRKEDGRISGGWYRVPYQREAVCCYRSDWSERWVEGIGKLMDTCHIDGVYLDGTSRLWPCANEAHGCGERDAEGNLHLTYPVDGVRRLFQNLSRTVHSRGGIINVHSAGAANFTVLPYIDLLWCGEDLQFDYCKGKFTDVALDYYRTAYTGRNTGVPVELIAYENRPVWKFENALACGIIHGILPRPNDIAWPLELMSRIWDAIESFPTQRAQWLPYWENGDAVTVSDPGVKVSFYRYEAPDGQVMLLLFAANVTTKDISGVRIALPEPVSAALRLPEKERIPVTDGGFTVDLPAYTSGIWYIR